MIKKICHDYYVFLENMFKKTAYTGVFYNLNDYEKGKTPYSFR